MDPKELVEEMARALVGKPEEVSTTELNGSNVTVIELKVAREDIGSVIGRGGRTVTAMRTIVGAVAARARRNVLLEIVQD